MKVPFADLNAQYQSIKTSVDEAISLTIKNSSYIGGQAVKDFETAFAAYLGMQHVIACGNGTDSIEILLKAMGVGTGDEVIVPAASWISTSEAVSTVGATPVFVDVEADYSTIDATLIAAAITPKTKAIIPVHLYGHPADMPAIMLIAKKHGLRVIEDCAQAHGAAIDGKMVGSFADAASFSFYPGKNLGAYGDAGCMATNDDCIAERARMIANHGQKGKHNHIMEGRNSRMDGLQAAILLAKLPFLKEWTDARIQNAALYGQKIQSASISKPVCRQGVKHVYHLYVIRTRNRDVIQNKLTQAGIETAIHYPKALPFLECYKKLNFSKTDFPVAFASQNSILSLPMYAELDQEQIKYVASILNNEN